MVLNNIAWIGRLTGPKGEIAFQILAEVAPRFPQIKFTLVGGPVTERFSRMVGGNVVLTGFVSDVNLIFDQADLVIGAGRVPVEAMQKQLPVIAVGENRYIGPVTAETIEQAKASNFGDCEQLHTWSAQRFIDDIQAIIDGEVAFPLQNYGAYISDYSIDTVYPKVMDVYRQAQIDAYLQGFKEIPALMYHRVLQQKPEGSRFNVYVTADELEQQIINLKKRGFEFVTFRDIANGVKARKPIMLTFDDGYEDNYQNLLPLLEKHSAKAVIYCLADRGLNNNRWDIAEGEPEAPLMSDEQLLSCHQSGLIEIGSHGLSHQHLPQLSDAEVRDEIFDSKQRLEHLIGEEVVSFAYPYGDYGDREAELVREAGYVFGIGTVNGPLKMADDLMRVRRITMFPNTKPSKFWRKTSGFYLRYCKLKGKDF